MLPDPLQDDPLGFWERLARAERPLLGLDYDGTLAPFHVDRRAAVPAAGAVEVLQEIIEDGRTRVAVISGRLADEVIALLGDLGVLVVGSHGFELRWPDGHKERIHLAQAQQEGLALAEHKVLELGHGERLERKAASLAFHTRGLPDNEAARLEHQVSALWDEAAEGLQCQRFNGGVELRVGDGTVHKGTVMADLLDAHQPDLAVYVGDDRTDEDAFRLLTLRGGVAIKVGPGPTAATARLSNCDGVVEFLHKWRKTLNSARA